MKKALLSGLALAALAAAPALAADMRVKAPAAAAPVAAVATWTGCFIGGNAGGIWAHKDWVEADVTSPFFGDSITSHDPTGFIGGGQIGCDLQISGPFVVGIQGDWDWTDATASSDDLIDIGATDRTRLRWLASVTGRLGFAFSDTFLAYVRGGAAWIRDDYDVFDSVTGITQATASQTRNGWTVGVGGEHLFLPNVSVFAEWDFYDFGTSRSTFLIPGGGGTFGMADIHQRVNVLKGGINLRFNWGSTTAVAARY